MRLQRAAVAQCQRRNEECDWKNVAQPFHPNDSDLPRRGRGFI
jgi:hypothetical protein